MVGAPHWPPRPLTEVERDVLDLVLSADFDGAEDLRTQATSAQSVGGCRCGCPSVDLLVSDEAAPRVQLPSRVVPAELQVQSNDEGVPGTVLLFVDDGLLSYLEYVDLTDEVPAAWPSTSQLSIHRRPN